MLVLLVGALCGRGEEVKETRGRSLIIGWRLRFCPAALSKMGQENWDGH